MNTPPLILNLSFGETGKTRFRLWLPIFLLIPFAYLVILLLDILFIPVLMILAPGGRKIECAKIAFFEPFRILNATKGLTVEVENPYQRVFISVR